jgi:hypothetical protein
VFSAEPVWLPPTPGCLSFRGTRNLHLPHRHHVSRQVRPRLDLVRDDPCVLPVPMQSPSRWGWTHRLVREGFMPSRRWPSPRHRMWRTSPPSMRSQGKPPLHPLRFAVAARPCADLIAGLLQVLAPLVRIKFPRNHAANDLFVFLHPEKTTSRFWPSTLPGFDPATQ